MAIEIISTLKPKNNGDFPVAEAKDIDVNGIRLDDLIENLKSEIVDEVLDSLPIAEEVSV